MTDRKVRLSIDCSPEERRRIKMLAAQEDKTISEYLLSLARNELSSAGAFAKQEKGQELSNNQTSNPRVPRHLEELWNAYGSA